MLQPGITLMNEIKPYAVLSRLFNFILLGVG